MNQFIQKGRKVIKIRATDKSGYLWLSLKLPVFLLLVFISENNLFSQTYLLNDATNGTTISTCTGKFYDSGGALGDYSKKEDFTVTFCSNNSFPLNFNFTYFKVHSTDDALFIYDGPNTSSTLIGKYSGTLTPFIVTGTCLTFRFVSDASFNWPGWEADISTFETSPISSASTVTCAGTTVNYSVASHLGSTYNWTVSDGTPSTFTDGNNLNVTWDMPGGVAALIKVVEINSCGGKDSSELRVDVFSSPVVDFSGLVSQAICVSDNAVFSVSATGYNLTYKWQEDGSDIADGGIYSGALTETLTLTAPGVAKNGKRYRCIVTGECHVPYTSNEVILTVDTQAPTWITGAGSLNRTLQCNDASGLTAAQALFPVATDNTDSDVTNIVKISGAFVPGSCPNSGSYTNTWTVTDACGNISAVFTQVITIIDTQAPVVAGSLSALTIEGCNAGAAPAAKTTVAELEALPGGITINDACTAKANLVVTSNTVSAGSCPIVVTRTYTVTDQCGNSVNIIHTINVNDTQAPVVVGTLTITTVEGCSAGAAPAPVNTVTALEALPGSITITDGCTPKASLVVTSIDIVSGTCPIVVTRTYTVKDQCGNSVNIIHKINVTDTQAPVVTSSLTPVTITGCSVGAAPAAKTTVAGLESLPGGIIITDACTAKANLTVTSSSVSAGTCPIVVTRTYTVKDQCGNSVNIIHTINVNDTQAPVVAGSLAATTEEGCIAGAAPAAKTTVAGIESLGGITINDVCTPKASLIVTSGTVYAGTCPIVVTRTYTIKDQCGNSVNIIHTINVRDTQAPTWTTTTGSLNRDLSCSDAAGIATAQALFPVAADNCDPDVTDIIKISGAFVAGSCPNSGSYTNTWTVTDLCGNVSAVYTQVITLTDIEAPVVTGSLTPATVVGCSVSATPATVTSVAALEALPGGITINDGCTTDANLVVTSSDAVSGTCPIIVTRTYTINDGCGNSVSVTHIITINPNDNTPPVITGTIPVTDTEGCSATDAPAAVTTVAALETMGLTISDACTPHANLVVTSSDASSGTCPVVITRTYNITDGCGNTSSVIQTINVDDTTLPSITGCPVDISVNNDPGNCNAVVTWISPAVTDNCGLFSVVSSHNSGDVFPTGTTLVTYTATDNCNNITTCSFNVIVTDNELPVITCPVPVSKNEDFGFSFASVTVPDAVISDNCTLSSLTWSMSGATTATSPATGINQIGTYTFNTGETTVTYILLDAAGNTATCDFKVTIIHPVPLSGVATPNSVACFGGNTGSITVTAAGGSIPYEYGIDAGSFQPSNIFTALPSGPHTVTIRDGSSNTVDIIVTITQPAAPLSVTTTQTNNVCFDAATGSATATASNGTGPYSYSWNSLPVQNLATASNLKAGTYTVTVTDNNGCTKTADVTITQPASAVAVTISKIDVLCFGGTNGSATAVGSGGTGPYSYSWNTSPVQNNAITTGLIAGTYTVTVTESFGCSVSGTVQIVEPAEIVIAETHQDVSCPDESDGSITLTLTGGTPPYAVLWSDANPAQNRTNLPQGTYSLIVTDGNGCNKPLNIDISVTGTFNCVVVPDIITPNNDGFNDKWVMKNIDLYPNAEVLIYNRWGELVFRTKNILADPWDGTFKGKLVPTDSYHYILYLNDGSKPKSGVISVIR